MAYTTGRYHLTNLLQDMYERLGQVTTYLAASGTTTTAVNTATGITDTNLSGSLFILETTDNAAPEGEFQRLSGFATGSGTFTVDTAFSAAVGTGDFVRYATPLYPLDSVIQLANSGLRGLGPLVKVDTTTLDTASDKTEYAAAVEWKYQPFRVDIQTHTDDANDNRWYLVKGWNYVPAAGGSTGLIIFDHQLTAVRDLRIWYREPHARVNNYDDKIHEAIHPELATAACVERALRWLNGRTGYVEPGFVQAWNESKQELQNAKELYPIFQERRPSKLLDASRGAREEEAPVGKVRL